MMDISPRIHCIEQKKAHGNYEGLRFIYEIKSRSGLNFFQVFLLIVVDATFRNILKKEK